MATVPIATKSDSVRLLRGGKNKKVTINTRDSKLDWLPNVWRDEAKSKLVYWHFSDNHPHCLPGNESVDFTIANAGEDHMMALGDGHIYSWGNGESGQLGYGTIPQKRIEKPTLVSNPDIAHTRFISISAGFVHSLAVSDESAKASGIAKGDAGVDAKGIVSGSAFSWGGCGDGKILGHKTKSDKAEIVPVPKLLDLPGIRFVKVSAGKYHSAALTWDGKLYTWGSKEVAEAIGQKTVLGKGGSVKTPKLIVTTKQVIFKDVATGIAHTLALTENGQLYSWGANDGGQLGSGNLEASKTPKRIEIDGVTFKQIAAAGKRCIALTSTGDVYTWGRAGDALGLGPDSENAVKPTKVQDLQNMKRVAIGPDVASAITQDGSIYVWGIVGDQELNIPKRLMSFEVCNLSWKMVSVGPDYLVGIAQKSPYPWWRFRTGFLNHRTPDDEASAWEEISENPPVSRYQLIGEKEDPRTKDELEEFKTLYSLMDCSEWTVEESYALSTPTKVKAMKTLITSVKKEGVATEFIDEAKIVKERLKKFVFKFLWNEKTKQAKNLAEGVRLVLGVVSVSEDEVAKICTEGLESTDGVLGEGVYLSGSINHTGSSGSESKQGFLLCAALLGSCQIVAGSEDEEPVEGVHSTFALCDRKGNITSTYKSGTTSPCFAIKNSDAVVPLYFIKAKHNDKNRKVTVKTVKPDKVNKPDETDVKQKDTKEKPTKNSTEVSDTKNNDKEAEDKQSNASEEDIVDDLKEQLKMKDEIVELKTQIINGFQKIEHYKDKVKKLKNELADERAKVAKLEEENAKLRGEKK